jgi:WD40 repeat protein
MEKSAQGDSVTRTNPTKSLWTVIAILLIGPLGYGAWRFYTNEEDIPVARVIMPDTLEGHGGPVYKVAVSPDGKTFASSSGDRTIKLWDLQTQQLLKTLSGHTAPVDSLAFSPDGQVLVSGGRDKTVKIWNLQAGKLVRSLLGGVEKVQAVAISPNGQILASGNKDKTIKLWDLQAGELIGTLTGHSEGL